MSYIKDIRFNTFRLTDLEGNPADVGGEINAILNFDYYESIFQPNISVTANLAGIEQLLASRSFKGTETLSFEISHPTGTLSFDDLSVSSMQQDDSSSTANLYTILATNPDSYKNYSNKLTQRFDPKAPISTHVSSILNTLGTSRPTYVEPTANSYGFFGNHWTPYKALYWLAKRSASGTGSSDGSGTSRVGFTFYERADGYRFESIDTIASEAKTNVIQTFRQSDVVDENENFNIYNARFEKDQNILDQMAKGMYSDSAKYFNIHSLAQGIRVPGQELSYANKVFSGQSHFGGDASIPPYSFNDSMNFDSVQFFVDGTMKTDGQMEYNAAGNGEDNIHKTKAQSRMRYASMMSRSLRMTVPLNFKLQAGLAIQANLMQSNVGSSQHQGGVFIIKDLRHSIEMTEDGIKGFTHLRLLSDSYGSDSDVTTNNFLE